MCQDTRQGVLVAILGEGLFLAAMRYWGCCLARIFAQGQQESFTHFKNYCHQLLLFMTEVGERTLEEVPVSILFSQGTVVMLGTPVIAGTSQFLQ